MQLSVQRSTFILAVHGPTQARQPESCASRDIRGARRLSNIHARTLRVMSLSAASSSAHRANSKVNPCQTYSLLGDASENSSRRLGRDARDPGAEGNEAADRREVRPRRLLAVHAYVQLQARSVYRFPTVHGTRLNNKRASAQRPPTRHRQSASKIDRVRYSIDWYRRRTGEGGTKGSCTATREVERRRSALCKIRGTRASARPATPSATRCAFGHRRPVRQPQVRIYDWDAGILQKARDGGRTRVYKDYNRCGYARRRWVPVIKRRTTWREGDDDNGSRKWVKPRDAAMGRRGHAAKCGNYSVEQEKK
ncbi:hypothetical protein BD414DRAFT_265121 [Trametes punicea]|nr:hypothetical protein BD414DRAFT_265121 [Trametes punicea]